MKLFKCTKSNWCVARCTKQEALEYFKDLASRQKFVEFSSHINGIEELKSPFNPKKFIHDDISYVEYCCELMDEWTESMINDDRYTRDIEEDESFEDERATRIYTDKGSSMVERALNRLSRLGEKHYVELTESIYTNNYREI